MGIKLRNAPVYYTLAQVQFNPILNLDAYIPGIQAEMRMAGSDFRTEIQQQVALPFGGIVNGQMVSPPVTQQSRYMFGDIEAKTHFIVDNNGLILQSTEYDTYSKHFLRVFCKGWAFCITFAAQFCGADWPSLFGCRLT